jgi:hypothetical protein
MTEYAVTIVWDVDAETGVGDLELENVATVVSHGKVLTTVYVESESFLRAYESALVDLLQAVDGPLPVGMAVEPVTIQPHFMFGAIGR